jgi:hypothetical protein
MHTPSSEGEMASHQKPSAKNADGDAPKILKPSDEVRKKMRPIARRSFHDLLRRVANQPARKRTSRVK